MAQSVNIAVRCPECGWRVMDKVSPTTGKIEIKCPHCHKIVEVDLALRRKVLYRRKAGYRCVMSQNCWAYTGTAFITW